MVRIEDRERRRRQAFGGDIDVFACQRRRCREEDLLLKCLFDYYQPFILLSDNSKVREQR